ncbi:MAG TPA: 4-hydroxy-tetrahydrodipicolinate synthase [Polyangiales bacterium]|nr:4-hydroxy-tetrahydrodipicolinate synthase [Polyangiales bacterium]
MFEGALTALVTPFRNDRVDERALRAIVSEQIAGGIDGLVPCGTTGEGYNLSDAEFAKVIETVVDEAKGRVPVLAGTGTASTHHTIVLSEIAQRLKADGLLVVVPYYNKPTQEGLYQHFTAIARAVPLPTVVYNIPGRCVVDMSLDTLERLAAVKTFVGIKESTGTVQRSAAIVQRFGDRFTVLSGDDAIALPIMAVGGHGVISVASNVAPKEVSQLVDLFRSGDVAAARKQHQRLAPLFEALFVESNPGPVKWAMAARGVMEGEIRLPLVKPSDASQASIRKVLVELGVL